MTAATITPPRRAGADIANPTQGVGQPGQPHPEPYRLAMLADDGTTAEQTVPDAANPDSWDRAEAILRSALTGKRYRPAGRTLRALGRDTPMVTDPFPGVRP